MTVQETRDTIITWVKSCTTQEQLNLLSEIINGFIVERFSHEDKTDVLDALSTVKWSILDQRKLITKTKFIK